MITIFVTYVYTGNSMDVASTVLATMMIDRIKATVNHLTNFYEKWINMDVSLTKVHEFLSAVEA